MSEPSAAGAAPKLVTSRWPVPLAAACLLAALAGFLAWQYLMPAAFHSSYFVNYAGVEHFRATLGLPRVEPSIETYRLVFRLLLTTVWLAYFAMIMAGAMGAPLPRRRTVSIAVVTATLIAAALWPPSFSSDVYGYVAYGRLQVLYGLNPYATSQVALGTLHDPIARFLTWNIASPYGPLWSLFSSALVWLLRGTGVFTQVMAMKLVAAGAVLGIAWVGRAVAERLERGRGDLTFLALGLNPLFIAEGPGNGHNDFVMMLLVLVTIGAALEGRTLRAVAVAGVAAALKFLPLMLVPWIVLAAWRARPAEWARRTREALVYGVAAFAPLVVGYRIYWLGTKTLFGLEQRWQSGQTSDGASHREMGAQALALLIFYGLVTLWYARGERTRLLTAWMAVAAAVYFTTAGALLPWYLSWIWVVALVRWQKREALFSYLAFCIAVALMLRYSVPRWT